LRHSLLKENELLHQGLSPMELPSATDRSVGDSLKRLLAARISWVLAGKPEVGTARQVCFELDGTVSKPRRRGNQPL